VHNRPDWHKESALGWLEEADKQTRLPAADQLGAVTSPDQKVAAAGVHALLYVGDRIAELNDTIYAAEEARRGR
jgi:hypothetical protein